MSFNSDNLFQKLGFTQEEMGKNEKSPIVRVQFYNFMSEQMQTTKVSLFGDEKAGKLFPTNVSTIYSRLKKSYLASVKG